MASETAKPAEAAKPAETAEPAASGAPGKPPGKRRALTPQQRRQQYVKDFEPSHPPPLEQQEEIELPKSKEDVERILVGGAWEGPWGRGWEG